MYVVDGVGIVLVSCYITIPVRVYELSVMSLSDVDVRAAFIPAVIITMENSEIL